MLGFDGEEYSEERVQIVRCAVKDRLDRLTKGIKTADPLKVFIKQEPHKKSKIEEGRFRLIQAVSVVDTIVDRILFKKMSSMFLKEHAQTKILMGWSPVKGGYRLIDALYRGLDTCSIDMKSWDWTVKHWTMLYVRRIIFSISNDPPAWWVEAVTNRFILLFEDPTFSFSDGSLATQPVKGVMKTGCYLTLIANSIGQMFLHHLAVHYLGLPHKNLERFIIVGDDTVRVMFDELFDYVKVIEDLGYRVEYEVHRKGVEFCGFEFDGNYIPAYRKKHLFALKHLTTEVEMAESVLVCYQLLYYFDKSMLDYIRKVAQTLGLRKAYVSDNRLRVLAQG